MEAVENILQELNLSETAPIYGVIKLIGVEAEKRGMNVARWQSGVRARNGLTIVWAVFDGMTPVHPVYLPEDALTARFGVPEGGGGNKTVAYRSLRSLLQRVLRLPVETTELEALEVGEVLEV